MKNKEDPKVNRIKIDKIHLPRWIIRQWNKCTEGGATAAKGSASLSDVWIVACINAGKNVREDKVFSQDKAQSLTANNR